MIEIKYPTSIKLVCGICFDSKTESEMFRSAKHRYHQFCLDCIGLYVADKIGQNIIEIRCPDLGCHGMLEPQNCRSAVAERVINQWEAALSESLIESKKKILCPFKDCSSPFLVAEEDEDDNQLVASVECPDCHRLFCHRCRVAWRGGGCKCNNNKKKSKGKGSSSSSSGGRKHHDKYVDRKFKSLVKKEKWKRCPGCKFYVQKQDGCEHIRCRCGLQFCYICGKGCDWGHTCPFSFLRRTMHKMLTIMKKFSCQRDTLSSN